GLLMLMVGCAAPPARSTEAPTVAAAASAPTAAATARSTPTGIAMPAVTIVPPSLSNCPVTPPVKDSAPSDRNASPVNDANWYINADRSIWAGTPPVAGWHVGGEET